MKELLLAAALMCVPVGALSHSFYDAECCSDQDCWPMGVDEDAKEPIPKYKDGFWVLRDGTKIADENTRDSPDGRFHTCRHGGRLDSSIIVLHGKPACLWVPRGSS